MRLYVLLTFLLIAGVSNAQQYPFYKYYALDKKVVQIDRLATDQIYYYNKYLLTIEYEFDPNVQRFFKYHTEHYRVKLNTHAAIEEFNKVYIDMSDVNSIVTVEARVIKPNEVLNVDIKLEEFYNEDEDEQYNYFAVKGLELGDELEILYTLKKSPLLNGDQFYFQGEAPIYNFDFRFILPNDAYFSFLSHNGLPQPVLVDTILQRHQYDIHLDTIPALKREYYTEYSNVSMKLDASLDKVDGDLDPDYSPYGAFVNYANETYNISQTGKNLKAIQSLNVHLGVKSTNTQIENIRIIENYMKNVFLIGHGRSGMSVYQMITEGKGSSTGSLQLFMGMLQAAKIPFEYGLTSDRYDTFFSPDIESDYFLQKYFFYFPDIDSYLAPLDSRSRLGFLNNNWVPNFGLFLTSKKNPTRSTDFKVKAIRPTTYLENKDSTLIFITVNADFSDVKITIERHFLGYNGGEEQVYYYLYTDARKKETHDELLDVFNDNSSYKMTRIENVNPEDAFIKPLIIEGVVTSLHVPIFEKAGNKILFRLGEIFGEYADPREIAKKKTDFVFSNAFSRTYEIYVNFENAIKVKNLENVPLTQKVTNVPDLDVSAACEITEKQIYIKQRSIYRSQRYSIDLKEEMIKIFNFHTEMSKAVLIIE